MFVDLTKRGVLTLVGEIRRYRNGSYYCYCCCYYDYDYLQEADTARHADVKVLPERQVGRERVHLPRQEELAVRRPAVGVVAFSHHVVTPAHPVPVVGLASLPEVWESRQNQAGSVAVTERAVGALLVRHEQAVARCPGLLLVPGPHGHQLRLRALVHVLDLDGGGCVQFDDAHPGCHRHCVRACCLERVVDWGRRRDQGRSVVEGEGEGGIEAEVVGGVERDVFSRFGVVSSRSHLAPSSQLQRVLADGAVHAVHVPVAGAARAGRCDVIRRDVSAPALRVVTHKRQRASRVIASLSAGGDRIGRWRHVDWCVIGDRSCGAAAFQEVVVETCTK